MKKLNFKKIPTTDLDGNPLFVDISKTLGNFIFQTTGDIGMFEKAKEIYHKGEVELTPEQKKEIKAIFKSGDNPFTVLATLATMKAMGPADEEPEGPDLPPKRG